MRSIRNIGILLALLLALLVMGLIYTNVQTRITFGHLNAIEQSNALISEGLEEMNLHQRVLLNISGQQLDDPEKVGRLTTAFNDNGDRLIISSSDTGRLVISVEESLMKIQTPIFRNQQIEALCYKLDIIEASTEEVNRKAMVIRTAGVLSDKEGITSLQQSYEVLSETYKSFQSDYYDFSASTRNRYVTVLTVITCLLAVVVLLLLLVVFRFIEVDMQLVRRTYTQIENHEFNADKVLDKRAWFEEEEQIHETVRQFFDDQSLIESFSNLVSTAYVMDDILDHLLETTNRLFGVNRVGIAFHDEATNSMVTEYGVATYDQLYLNVGYRADLSSSSLKKVITDKEGYINNDVLETFEKAPESMSQMMIIREGIRSNMSIPLIMNNQVFGVVFLSSKKANHFTQQHYDLATKLIYEITGALNRSYLMKVFMFHITGAFAKLVDKKDIETGDHLNRMVAYSKIISEGLKEMNLESHPVDNKFILEIERNAAVHDIGKVGTPDYILKKPGPLTVEEYEVMKEHTLIGAEIFTNLNQELKEFGVKFFGTAEKIAKYHHEKWDGSGYPRGLKGEEIPLYARVVALADVFDALTSKRVYKEPFEFNDSLEIIHDGIGKHFDPEVVKAFDNKLKDIRDVYESLRQQ